MGSKAGAESVSGAGIAENVLGHGVYFALVEGGESDFFIETVVDLVV